MEKKTLSFNCTIFRNRLFLSMSNTEKQTDLLINELMASSKRYSDPKKVTSSPFLDKESNEYNVCRRLQYSSFDTSLCSQSGSYPLRLHCEPPWLQGEPLWPHFEPPQLPTFDFDVDQDLAFDFDTDPEPAFHANADLNADPDPGFPL
jgi:hypothetical protein